MTRGDIPIELGYSWLTAKTMVVVLSIYSLNGVQHRFNPELGQFIEGESILPICVIDKSGH